MKFRIVYGRQIEYFVNDKKVTKKEFDAMHKKVAGLRCGGQRVATVSHQSKAWPRKSKAIGVHTTQIDGIQEKLRKRGVPTEFDRTTGEAIIRDNAHQRDLLKAFGMVNYDGGYGQVTG